MSLRAGYGSVVSTTTGVAPTESQTRRFRYNSPWMQVFLVGFVAFCSVGMHSAMSNLGAGGLQDVQLSDMANSVLYGCFFIGGFFAGSVNNILGPRLTLSLGTTGYVVYMGALWNFQVHGTRWLLILAGAILGFSAALFWAAQGAIMMSYPAEKDKGRSFSLFWVLFQMGTLVGSSVALGMQFRNSLPTVSTSIYVVFIVIQLTSVATSWLVLPPQKVVRGDDTLVELQASISPKQEAKEFVQMFKDWRMLALLPMFFSSNYFYAYQSALTAYLFNGRTRALVALATGVGSIVGSIVIGLFTDTMPFSRRNRAFASWGLVLALACSVWGGGLSFQIQFDRGDAQVLGRKVPWDLTVGVATGPIILIFCYYVVDATFQGLIYYTMSSITNDAFRLARMAGFYKGLQSAGAAVSFGMDAVKTPYLTELLVSWMLILTSLPLCLWVLYGIRESNYKVEATAHVNGEDGETAASGVLRQQDIGEGPATLDDDTEALLSRQR